MKTIVITGSTRGIGFGLADAFLSRDCAVVISGRGQASVDEALARLAEQHPAGQMAGVPCDVTDYEQVRALWQQAEARFGRVDVWINNAGLANDQADFWNLEPGLIRNVVSTNLTGTMYGSKVALENMLRQGGGSLYNMEGLGSNRGRTVPGMTLYASTKAGLRYFNDALIKETRRGPVLVGALQPGMVVTDLLIRGRDAEPENWERTKRVFNILADRPETVTPWLANEILANHEHGKRIN